MISLTAQTAWRNIWRNPRRSILTMSAVAFAAVVLVFMLSWQFGAYETMISSAVSLHTGHIQVQAEGYNEKPDMGRVVQRPGKVAEILGGIQGVKGYTNRAGAFSLVSSQDRTYASLVLGIDPVKEPGVSRLDALVRRGSFLEPGDAERAVLGRLLARRLKIREGDEIVLLGRGRDGSIAASAVSVKGILGSGQDDFDRSTLLIPLEAFQEIYSMRGAVHQVVALGEDLDPVPRIKQELSLELAAHEDLKGLAVLDWKELMPGLVEGIKMDMVSGFVFYVILIVVVAFSIMNTFLMSVMERKREFGVLLALGSRPGRLARMVLMECGLMTGLGIAAGIMAGAAVTLWFQSHGLALPGASELLGQFGLPDRMHPELSFMSVFVGAGVVFAVTSLAIVYPAARILRLRPAGALAGA